MTHLDLEGIYYKNICLFTIIYLVLFYPLLLYNLYVPIYLNNRLRYCAAWLERDKHSLLGLSKNTSIYEYIVITYDHI